MLFEPLVAEGYEWINCVDESDYELLASFDGTSRLDNWTPVNVRTVRADENQEQKPSDFPWLGSDALIMGAKAAHVLRDLLEASGELLPLSCENGRELFIYNVTRIIDALDDKQSAVVRYPDSDRIMWVRSYSFHNDLVQGVDVFRLPNPASPTFLSGRFVRAVKSGDLVGLDFKQVWASE